MRNKNRFYTRNIILYALQKLFLCCLMIVVGILANPVFAATAIYKCKDKNGRVVFSQQATCQKPERINYSQKQLVDRKKEEEERKREEALEKQQEQCDDAKATLKVYQKADFLTKTVIKNGKSVKVRLTAEEAKKTIQDAKDEVEYWCQDL